MPYRVVSASLTLLGLLVLGIATSFAFVPPDEASDLTLPLSLGQNLYLHDAASIAAEPAARAYRQTLSETLGNGWYVASWNQYTQTAQAVEGPGLVLAAGGFAEATTAEMEQVGRAFIAAHPELFGTDGSNLEVEKIAHGADKWGVIFHQVENGIEVTYSDVMLAIHDNGRLFAFGSNVHRQIDIALVPTFDRTMARALARSAVPFDPQSELEAGPEETLVLPVHRGPGDIEYHLVHVTDVPTARPFGMWRTMVDAHSGDIVQRWNEVHFVYEGNAQNDAEVVSYCDGITQKPSANMYVNISGAGIATTDANGDFAIGSGASPLSYTATLDGPKFRINCYGCTAGQITGTIYPDTPESILWDSSEARADERDVWYYANKTKDYILYLDPAFYLPKYNAYVNRPGTCNAYHQGTTINFYPAGGGCANTGTIGDVVAHEYGHGIQVALIGSQGIQGLGEGNSDISGTFQVDIPTIGRGFYNCNGGIRTCNNSMQYPDDLTGDIYNDGSIICGYNWDLREIMEAKLGPADGKDRTAYLWHFARKDYCTSGSNQQVQVNGYRYADDDDGNLNNGTPNWDEICEAATMHGYTCPVNPNRVTIAHTPIPDTANPAGPYTVQADITLFVENIQTPPEETEIYYALNGGAFTMATMSNVGGNTYEFDIPSQSAGTTVTYYIRAAHSGGVEGFHPAGAPAVYHMFGVGTFDLIAEHQMEADDGYTVGAPGDNATDGIWERDDPLGVQFGLVYQPEYDHTPAPGTDCWITGNPPTASPFVEELDGRTSLNTPVFDLAGATMVKGSFWGWTYFSIAGFGDYLDLNMTTDGGNTWTTLHHIDHVTSPDWEEFTFRLSPHDFTFSSQTQFRFVADDAPPDGLVEALVDDFHVEALFGTSTAVESNGSTPLVLRLGQARPNPFNPSTEISYSLPTRSEVRLAIYDVKGRLIRNLVDRIQDAGNHASSWDGRDAIGSPAASGVYYYKLEVGDWSDTHSMVLLK